MTLAEAPWVVDEEEPHPEHSTRPAAITRESSDPGTLNPYGSTKTNAGAMFRLLSWRS